MHIKVICAGRNILPATMIVLIIFTLFISAGCTGDSSYKIEFDSLNTRTTASIRALYVVDDQTVWAAGSGGTFLLTTDGGRTWKKGIIPGAENDDFRSIHAWSTDKALLFGVANPGRGYMTTTAGEYWEIVYEKDTEGIFFDSMIFADEMNGVALSDPLDSTSFLIKTNDGGRTWSHIENLPPLENGEFNFAASNSCIDFHSSGMMWYITGGTNARLFRSENSGDKWEVFNTPIAHGSSTSGIFSVSFLDDNNGLIVGGTYDQPELNDRIAARSGDGGKTWKVSEIMPAQYRSSVIWLGSDGQLALAAGKTGLDYSTDMGQTWNFLSDEGFYTIRGIAGKLEGYAAGADGRISKFMITKTSR